MAKPAVPTTDVASMQLAAESTPELGTESSTKLQVLASPVKRWVITKTTAQRAVVWAKEMVDVPVVVNRRPVGPQR
jgi:hypothetical protein